MSYQSLYRKYRPQNFNEVVGQDNIITTLSNAVNNDKISHAYLFSGPRGCGKTSIAKIFAREVNCTCQDHSCPTCQLFAQGEVSDVWEIDAASNNGVDEVRRIIENVTYTPMDLKYKVYIIDEVHMLSKAAFNALLKTLEEPPAHVIFILATTEIYKIPATILSRCQRFDFRRISVNDIVLRLKEVLDNEQISYEEEALIKVAKLADGGMRDALSLIEKVRTYSEVITINAVNSSLQLVGDEQINELLKLIIQGDLNELIAYYQDIVSLGIDENKFIIDIQFYIRDLLLKDSEFNRRRLIELLKLFNELESKLQFTSNFNLVIEVYLIEMATLDELASNVTPQGTQNKTSFTKVQEKVSKDEHQEKLKIQKEALLNNQMEVNNANPDDNQFANQVSIKDKVTSELNREESVAIDLRDDRQTDVMDFLLGSDLSAESNVSAMFEDEVTPIDSPVQEINQAVNYSQNTANSYENNVNSEELNTGHQIVNKKDIAFKSEEVDDNIVILDVLKAATVDDKKMIFNGFNQMKINLENDGKYGIAKFFEYAEIQAASPIGYVLTIDIKLYDSYLKRITEIEDIFNNYLEKKVKIFLLERNIWQSKRPEYVQAIKDMKEKDIFKMATEEFGHEIVKKI